ncbi:unnamed protein product, partial [Iphiclides podalirius]
MTNFQQNENSNSRTSGGRPPAPPPPRPPPPTQHNYSPAIPTGTRYKASNETREQSVGEQYANFQKHPAPSDAGFKSARWREPGNNGEKTVSRFPRHCAPHPRPYLRAKIFRSPFGRGVRLARFDPAIRGGGRSEGGIFGLPPPPSPMPS